MLRPRPSRSARWLPLVLSGMWLGAAALPAHACAVCQGSPDDPMTRGAAAGVVVLALVIYTVLLGFASVALYWVVRARRMYRTPADAVATN